MVVRLPQYRQSGGSVSLASKPSGIVGTIRAPLAEVRVLAKKPDNRQE
jgi:hypothetical protein